MMPEFELLHRLDHTADEAAAATLRRAGARAKAPATDIDLVLNVVFAEVKS